MKPILTASVALISLSQIANAADWPRVDIDEAFQMVAARERDSIQECVVSSGAKIVYDAQQKDIDGDGTNELVVSSYPNELGGGATGCYGMVGRNMYLLGHEGESWKLLVVGDNTHDFVFHDRSHGDMPDVESTGPGSCFPIQRFYKGEYRLWKVCDGDRQLFAAEALWIDDKSDVVPSDFGVPARNDDVVVENASAISDADARAMIENRHIFDHNGSAMIVDPGAGTIVYRDPKKAISGTVKSGALLFKATGSWDPYDDTAVVKGTAYVFKKGCEPAPYEVSGRQQGWHTLVLMGAAPVRAKNGCKINGYAMNGNATLKFESWGD